MSDIRNLPDGTRPIGKAVWMGGFGLLFELALLLFNACHADGRKAILTPTADRIRGRTPILLWAVAVLEAVVVIVVWL